MNRFEDADSATVSMVLAVVADTFPQLLNANISVVFDGKKRMKAGQYTLGRMKKTNETERLLSATNMMEDGFDYILFLDRVVFTAASDIDKVRLIRHELQHCGVDMEKDNPYGIKDHEVTDFYEEIEFNKDDPRWGERLATIAESIYSADD